MMNWVAAGYCGTPRSNSIRNAIGITHSASSRAPRNRPTMVRVPARADLVGLREQQRDAEDAGDRAADHHHVGRVPTR